jgi:hypothetical protein
MTGFVIDHTLTVANGQCSAADFIMALVAE